MRRNQYENEEEYDGSRRGSRGQEAEGNRYYGAAPSNRGEYDTGRNWERSFGYQGGNEGGYQGGYNPGGYAGGGRYEGERYYGRPNTQTDYERQQWGGQQGAYGGGQGYWGEGGRMGMGTSGQQRQNRQFKPPRGFTRNDERIREEIVEKLMRHDIDASEVEIKVTDGEVTLTGTVTERQDKRLIEDLAEDVLGVKDVNNQIRRVQKDGGQQLQKGGNGTQDRGAQRTDRTQGVHG